MNDNEIIKIPQNISLISIIKAITNIEVNMVPYIVEINGEKVEGATYYLNQDVGTEYKISYNKYFKEDKEKKTIKLGILFKDFYRTDDIPYPKYSDKHLKMLLYILSKWENEFEFLATEFNELCKISKRHSKNIENNYNILKDLLKIEIRIIDDEIDIQKGQEYEYFPLLELISRRDKISRIKRIESLNDFGVTTEKTMSRAKIQLGEIIDLEACGQMFIPSNFFKMQINSKINLGATSLLFNLLYLESIKNNKKETEVIYNVSTILSWMGINEEKYNDFFIKNKKMTHSYYVSRLNKIFIHLADCGIKADFKKVKVKNKIEFYKKEQVIFDLTELKLLLKR